VRVVAVELGLLVALGASGCVTRASYEAEQAQNASLRHELVQRKLRTVELEQRIRDLESSRETLQLERRSLDEERMALIADLDELRTGNVQLRTRLAAEKQVRELREAELAAIGGTYDRLVSQLEQEVSSGQIEIERLRAGLQVRALEKILFDSGSTEIKPSGKAVLAKVARQIRQIEDHRVRVEGHTDSVPIATARFPSNWELSAARAAVVVRFLIEQQLDANSVEAVGRGQMAPIADNRTAEGRARNRRIEIVLVPEEGG
jgi:chemotaxis protein MotB